MIEVPFSRDFSFGRLSHDVEGLEGSIVTGRNWDSYEIFLHLAPELLERARTKFWVRGLKHW